MVSHRGYRSWEHLCVTKMKHSLTIWFCRDELSFAMLFWEDMIALISMLEVLLFLCQYELLSWMFRIWIFIPQLRSFTLKLCQSITPHQKFFFIIYLLEGAGIKLGDAWYVSNVSIIFDCSMLLYLLFWTILGCIFHFYIIFGTNLLTGGPAQNGCFFAYFSVSKKQNIKQSPNGMKPSGTWFSRQTWSRRLGPCSKE